MDDERRCEHERSGWKNGLKPLGADQDRQLAREDEEEIGVIAVHVRARTVEAGAHSSPRGAQLIVVAENLEPPVLGVAD